MSSTPIDLSVCTNSLDLGFANLSWLQTIFLGIVQGFTELLPISSTAHLRVVPGLLGWPDPGSAFSAAMQLASFAAVISYFYKDIKEIVTQGTRDVVNKNFSTPSAQMWLGIAIGTIPLVICGALLKTTLNECNSPLRSLWVIGVACVVMSLLLAWSETKAKHDRSFGEITTRDGILVGIAQVFALIPGVSRSGSTLTAALFCGMNRETAARFSFLLGLPAITLAGAHEIFVLAKAGLDIRAWEILGVGLVSASITAFIAIYGLLKYLENSSTWIFVWYRFALGCFLILGSVFSIF